MARESGRFERYILLRIGRWRHGTVGSDVYRVFIISVENRESGNMMI